jgi:hypothetical protein
MRHVNPDAAGLVGPPERGIGLANSRERGYLSHLLGRVPLSHDLLYRRRTLRHFPRRIAR